MDGKEREKRLSRPIDRHEEYLWAVILELRKLRELLAPEKATGEDIRLREAEDKG